MTRSERQRIGAKLARWMEKYDQTIETNPDSAAALAAAVDWLRAECKLADDLFDDHGDRSDGLLADAAVKVAELARGLLKEILEETRK